MSEEKKPFHNPFGALAGFRNGLPASKSPKEKSKEKKAPSKCAVRLERAGRRGKTEALRQEVTQRLEKVLREVKGELDEVVTRVTADALKQRAAELGTVEAVHEDANGGLTIKVRV
jgi:hypothetical protein